MKDILVKTNNGKISIDLWAEIEYKRVLLIMKLIEETFSINLNEYPKLRKAILNTANYIRRLPFEISEVVRTDIK